MILDETKPTWCATSLEATAYTQVLSAPLHPPKLGDFEPSSTVLIQSEIPVLGVDAKRVFG